MLTKYLLPILALWTLSIAQPLLAVLEEGAEFFVVRGSSRIEIFLVVFILSLLAPLLLGFLLFGISKLSEALGKVVRALSIFILSGILIAPILSRYEAGPLLSCGGAIGGALFAVWSIRFEATKQFLYVLSCGALIVPTLFLSSSNLRSILYPRHLKEFATKKTDTPVVMIVLDELSSSILLNDQGRVDERMFPHLAAFERTSTSYPNTTTVNPFTQLAVPALLSGKLPNIKRLLPILSNYPGNLFTLLQNSHQETVIEPIVRLCPPKVCGEKKEEKNSTLIVSLKETFSDIAAIFLNIVIPKGIDLGQPEITGQWSDFWNSEIEDWELTRSQDTLRLASFEYNINKFTPKSGKPFLFYLHTILPHMSLHYSPSGKIYSRTNDRHGYIKDRWEDDEVAIRNNYTKFSWQMSAVDKALGKLFRRLKALNVYDESIIVITSDHGISIAPNTFRRGHPSQDNFYRDVLAVPLFIKAPDQKEGIRDEIHAESIDILPTIADLAGIKIPWDVDGTSLLKPHQKSTKRVFVGKTTEKRVMLGSAEQQELAAIQEFPAIPVFPNETTIFRNSIFTGKAQGDVYYTGLLPELIGRDINDPSLPLHPLAVTLKTKVSEKNGNQVVFFAKKSQVSPSRYYGKVLKLPENYGIAFFVEGKLRAVQRPFKFHKDPEQEFEILVDESAFKEGENKLEWRGIELH